MIVDLRRGDVVWADLDPTLGREQAGRRPVLVVASDIFLAKADIKEGSQRPLAGDYETWATP